MTFFLHEEAFKSVVAALRQSNGPVQSLEQKAKAEVGKTFETKLRKEAKQRLGAHGKIWT